MSEHVAQQVEYRRASGGPFVASWLPLVESLREPLVDQMGECARLGADMVALELPWEEGIYFDAAGAQLCGSASESLGLEASLDLVAASRPHVDAPVLLMTYAQPLLAFGAERAFEQIAASGVDAVSVIDLPMSEAGAIDLDPLPTSVAEACVGAGLTLVYGTTAVVDRSGLSRTKERADELLWCQDPFDPDDSSFRTAIRDQKRLARRVGRTLMADPTELPQQKVARKLSGILLRRIGSRAWSSGLVIADAAYDALRELGGSER